MPVAGITGQRSPFHQSNDVKPDVLLQRSDWSGNISGAQVVRPESRAMCSGSGFAVFYACVIYTLQLPAPMATSGWLEGAVPTRDVWRSVSSTCGGLSVMTCGHRLMPEWFADSWDTQALVSVP